MTSILAFKHTKMGEGKDGVFRLATTLVDSSVVNYSEVFLACRHSLGSVVDSGLVGLSDADSGN